MRWSTRRGPSATPREPTRSLDRPEHVRAASAVAFFGARIAIVQDDANFIALVDPRAADGDVTAIPLDPGHGGLRQFDDTRGNKKHKLDLEACVVVPSASGPVLLAFGSGSSPARERILVARDLDREPRVQLVHAAGLYAALRACTDFSGSELNVEGATRIGDRVRLFNRGNGAPRGEVLPVNATCDVRVDELLAHLQGGAAPALADVVAYDLGAIDGVRLGFTDAATVGDRVFYLAAAEASPDAVQDGPVAGVAIGVIDGARVRYAIVQHGDRAFDGKAEGIAFEGEDPRRGWLVVDRDEPSTAGEIHAFTLEGAW